MPVEYTDSPQDATLSHYAGYTEEELQPCFLLMMDYLYGPVKHDAFFKKYAHKKFLKGKSMSLPVAAFLISHLSSIDGGPQLGQDTRT